MAKKQSIERIIKSSAEDSYKQVTNEKLKISFQYIDWESEEFFIHGLSKTYYQLLFEAFHEIQMATSDEIKQQIHPRLTPKFINWKGDSTLTRRHFPDKIKKSLIPQCGNDENELQKQFEEITRDSFELRVARTYGRIHGFIFDNTFYIVWFDPAHNLFPGLDDKRKVKKIKLPEEIRQVKSFCPEEINRIKQENISLYQENQELLQKNEELMKLLDTLTTPDT
ncbi:hypothetical protein [Anabaena sp. UHCC 0451]|uniref:hypothetical protein n=1 Tax=Anabaena sp. UHCC 0451 TaxID=2055235 RepID=UPI002B1E90F9|nr:hypothetical protein [Anabaena sp. UHCC 0451]MEA5579531.1 hypothetical protein [Anabaena sp. UHCC 0451]